MNSTPIVPGDRPLMVIVYKYNYRKVLVFIANDGDGNTEPGDTYLSRYPDNCFNVYVRPIVCPCLKGRSFNACNSIYNHNKMWQSYPEVNKYLVTQRDYFRLMTTVEFYSRWEDPNLS